MGRRYKNNKKWGRKRKADEKSAKSTKERKNGGWNPATNSNAKFEAYYSLVGLHDTRYDAEKKEFVPCQTDAEKTAERDLYMSTLRSILPASFRIDRSLDPTIQQTLLEEMREFTGKEMELEVELPRRSAPIGGMKTILAQGADGEKEADVKAAKVANDANGDGDAAANENEEPAKEDDGPILVKRTVAPAKPIPFVSHRGTTLGYQLSVDRSTLRRNKSLESLHSWLKIHTDCGHITRQETVSMIPPVVLDAKEGMSVLDMCAAPGSKTCQLLEVVGGLTHASENGGEGTSNGAELEPKGYVVANDADPKRAYMLVNQLRRMNSPSVFVTSCDGQYFPILDDKSVRGTEREGTFDRVLCDVPCSGDGTVRKNPGIWKHWNQLGSLSLHPLQLSIALRGARLTNVGGYLVYSTCSMNPVENESVVAELLRIANGALVLEDPRDRMEGLIARPGWNSWCVLRENSRHSTRKKMKAWHKKNNSKMSEKRKEWEEKREKGECPPPKEREAEKVEEDKEYTPSPYDTIPYVPPATWDEAALRERTTSLGFLEYASYDEVEPEWRRRVRASVFPPTVEEASQLELHKCLRCLPQDMDTGGFFVALLKKVKPLGKDANERMNAMAREWRGGVDVDAHLKKGGDGTNAEKKAIGEVAEDVVMTESSAAEETSATEDKTDTEPATDAKKAEERGGAEIVQKAPVGKIGMRHKHKKKGDVGKEDFMPCDPSLLPALVEEYGLASTFPKDQIFVRASGEAKVLYFLSGSIKSDLIDRGIQDRVTVINSGLKCFERCSLQDKKVGYRLAQEGIQYVVPHMTKRMLSAGMDDFYACNKTGFIPLDKFSESFQKALEEVTTGSFIVALEGYEKDVSKKMYLAMWRRSNCVNCFVTKVEMDAILSKMKALGYVAPKEEDATKEDETADTAVDEPANAAKEKMDTN
ncbi:hypothetical protein ACHAXT_006189 [Thalassiosira profunda]